MLLIVGISGVTCGGKTTLSLEIKKLFPTTHIISQDDYFREVDDPKHLWIPELNHINFDIISSLDMERMYSDIQEYIKNKDKCIVSNHKRKCIEQCGSLSNLQEMAFNKVKESNINIVIIEGFCVFKYKPICDLCDLKYFLTLSHDQCVTRRSKRIYEPQDCPGYFEACVWPEYQKLLTEVENCVIDVKYLDSGVDASFKTMLSSILLDIISY